jgi:hypothetical protein
MKRSWLLGVAILLALLSATLVLARQKPERAKGIIPGSKGTVLIFVASLCPCTDAHRIMVDNLLEKTGPKGIRFYAVFSNLGETEERAEYFYRNIGWDMPYYLDTDGEVAKEYKATRTPQTVTLSPKGKVLFNGPIDDANLNQGRVEHAYLKDALEDIIAGKRVRNPEVPPLGGCWIVRDTTTVPCQLEK